MKTLCKLAKWSLVALTAIFILTGLNQILVIAFFLAALVVMFPPTETALVQMFPWLEKGFAKFAVWFVLVSIGFLLFTTPEELTAQAKQRVAKLESDGNVKELVQVLQKQNYGASEAAIALGNLGDREAVTPLIATLQEATKPEIRRSAAEALGKLNDPQAVQPLLKATNDEDASVAGSASNALQQLAAQDPEVVQLTQKKDVSGLIAVLQKQDYRGAAVAQILGELQDKQAIPPLIKALETAPETSIRFAAADALGRFQDDQAIQGVIKGLGAPGSVSARSNLVLTQNAPKNPKIMPLLMAALKTGNATVGKTLVEIGTPAVEPLIATLEDATAENRVQAAQLLGQIGDPRAIPPLVARLVNWEFAPTAGTALKQLKWTPELEADKVHWWVALGENNELEQNWEIVKKVLIADIQSKDPGRIRYGLYTFISLGNQETITSLIQTLNEHGNKTMALVYLNCGQPELEGAAEKWATARGYRVVRQPGVQTEGPTWGSGL